MKEPPAWRRALGLLLMSAAGFCFLNALNIGIVTGARAGIDPPLVREASFNHAQAFDLLGMFLAVAGALFWRFRPAFGTRLEATQLFENIGGFVVEQKNHVISRLLFSLFLSFLFIVFWGIALTLAGGLFG